jgi:hypothetical protein
MTVELDDEVGARPVGVDFVSTDHGVHSRQKQSGLLAHVEEQCFKLMAAELVVDEVT